jgi:hypothetical protein
VLPAAAILYHGSRDTDPGEARASAAAAVDPMASEVDRDAIGLHLQARR